jgi:hypothetical protein
MAPTIVPNKPSTAADTKLSHGGRGFPAGGRWRKHPCQDENHSRNKSPHPRAAVPPTKHNRSELGPARKPQPRTLSWAWPYRRILPELSISSMQRRDYNHCVTSKRPIPLLSVSIRAQPSWPAALGFVSAPQIITWTGPLDCASAGMPAPLSAIADSAIAIIVNTSFVYISTYPSLICCRDISCGNPRSLRSRHKPLILSRDWRKRHPPFISFSSILSNV